MSTTPHKINLEELDTVSGGSRPDWLHDKNNYIQMTVIVPENTCLVMQLTPAGKFMNVKYYNGEPILVHRTYIENGYRLAYNYQAQKYGFVDANHVR